jgi:hypothetical protein
MKSRLIEAIKNMISLWEIEVFYDYGAKTYGLRKVRRKIFPRKDGWREYGDACASFSIPAHQIKKLHNEMKLFVRDGRA